MFLKLWLKGFKKKNIPLYLFLLPVDLIINPFGGRLVFDLQQLAQAGALVACRQTHDSAPGTDTTVLSEHQFQFKQGECQGP